MEGQELSFGDEVQLMKTIAEQQGISVETVAMVALQKEVRTLQELVATVGDLVIAKL